MAPATPQDSPFAGHERYTVRRVLGAGGMGVVYEALDHERGSPVALKTLRRLDPAALYRFKREFRALAGAVHPNLVKLYELVAEGERAFFSMELVRGVDFLRYVGHPTWPGADTATGHSRPDSTDAEFPRALTRSRTRSEHFAGPREETRAFPESQSVDLSDVRGADDVAGPPMAPAADSTVPRALPLPARVRADDVASCLDVPRLRHALRQLADAVTALHGMGYLHRDLKPSNVLVTDEGRLVLLDLGLVTWINPAEASFERYVAGTAAYMSPEQALARPLAEPTDWYSLGVMLYEALTGTRPFRGTFEQVLRAKHTQVPVPPSELVASVPPDLEALCLDLLQQEPADRPTGEQILERLSAAGPADELEGVVPSFGPSASLQAPGSAFVGRDDHLEALQEAYRAAADGATVTVHLMGPSGMGKSSLLRHFLDELALGRDGAVVLSGRCYERESVPYKAVDGLIDSLSRYLRSLPKGRVDSLLPRGIEALARVFPVLGQVEAVSNARGQMPAVDPHELRRRAFIALRELLRRIGSRRPLVLCVDDLQWGDLDSVHLLVDLVRPIDPPSLLLLASYRAEEVESCPHLKALRRAQLPDVEQPTSGGYLPVPEGSLDQPLPTRPDVVEIDVGPLPRQTVIDLAIRLLGGEDSVTRRQQAGAIAAEARGNPFFAHELVRWVQHTEADLTGLQAGDGVRASTPARVRLESVLRARVEALPPAARDVLEAVAVAGRPVPRSVLRIATDVGAREHDAIDLLRSTHLLRVRDTGGEEAVETYHDRIREVLVAEMPTYQLRERHLRMALALQGSRYADPEPLAEHYAGAGHLEKAGEYALLAADQASEALAFDRAAMLLRFAMRTLEREDVAWRGLEVRLADALANAGRAGEAAELYLGCVASAQGYDAVALQARAAEEFLRNGQLAEGTQALGGVLSAVRMKMPDTPGGAVRSLALRRVRLRMRGLGWRERPAEDVTTAQRMRVDVCLAVASSLGMIDTIRGADFQTRGLLLALQIGEPSRVARALVMESIYASTTGTAGRKRAARILAEAAGLAERLGEPLLRGLIALAASVAAYQGGEWTRAREMAQRAERIFTEQCSGATLEVATTRHFLLLALLQLGELAEMGIRAPAYIAAAEARGDRFTSTSFRNGCMNITWLADDRPTDARGAVQRAMRSWGDTGFLLQHYEGLYAEATIDLYCGDGASAYERIVAAWPKLRGSQLLRLQQLHLEVLYLRGRAAIAAGHPKEARSVAARMRREGMAWADPLAELLLAGADASEGALQNAAQRLEGLVPALDLRDMHLYAAAARARLGATRGGPGGADAVHRAHAAMAAQGIRRPERMVALFAPGWPD